MSKIVIVRYLARTSEAAEENQALVENVFAQLAAERPDDLQYATFRLDDGRTFVHLAIHEGDGNALDGLESFHEFTRGSRHRVTGSPRSLRLPSWGPTG